MEQAQPESTFLISAERISKAAGLLAAAGYISLKAHQNYLGFPPGTGLDPSRYLWEVWYLMSTTMVKLAYLCLIVGPLCLLIHVVRRRRGGLPQLVSAVAQGIAASSPRLLIPLLLLAIAVLAVVALDVALPPGGAVLHPSGSQPWFLGGAYYDAWVVAWIAFTLLVSALRPLSEDALGSKAQRELYSLCRSACQVAVWVLAAALCVAFGVGVHSRDYPLVEIEKPGSGEKAVLLASSGGQLSFVTKDGGPALRTWSAEHVGMRFLGDVDVLVWLQDNGNTPKATSAPSASMAGGSGGEVRR